MWKRTRNAARTDDCLTQASAVVEDACDALDQRIAERCAMLADVLAGGRRVRQIWADEERGSVTVCCDDVTVTCATPTAAAVAQIAAMVHLEPTIVRPGSRVAGAMLLSFVSPSWAYALQVVPQL